MNPEVIGSRIMQIMEERNITLKQLSDQMKTNEKNLKKKLEGGEEFQLQEMKKIKEIFHLDLEEFDELFFQESFEERHAMSLNK